MLHSVDMPFITYYSLACPLILGLRPPYNQTLQPLPGLALPHVVEIPHGSALIRSELIEKSTNPLPKPRHQTESLSSKFHFEVATGSHSCVLERDFVGGARQSFLVGLLLNSVGRKATLGAVVPCWGPVQSRSWQSLGYFRPEVEKSARLVGNPGLDCTEEEFTCFPDTY